MDFEKALRFVETYAREYLLYLLDFFRRKRGDARTEVDTQEGKIVVYAMISASIGLLLSHKFVSNQDLTSQAFAIALFVKFAYWLAIALFLHLMLAALRARTDFMVSLLTTLTVMPVAYALGGYAAYLMNKLSWLWIEQPAVREAADALKAAAQGQAAAGHYGYKGAVAVQLVVATIYFPRVLSRNPELAHWRVAIASVGVSLLLGVVQLAAYLQNFKIRGV